MIKTLMERPIPAGPDVTDETGGARDRDLRLHGILTEIDPSDAGRST